MHNEFCNGKFTRQNVSHTCPFEAKGIILNPVKLLGEVESVKY